VRCGMLFLVFLVVIPSTASEPAFSRSLKCYAAMQTMDFQFWTARFLGAANEKRETAGSLG